MLVVTRKERERIQIGNAIFVTVIRTRNNHVRIGIEAPPAENIKRLPPEELLDTPSPDITDPDARK